MEEETSINEVAQIERLVRGSTVLTGGEVSFVIVPDGYTLKDLEDLQAAPRRIRETAKLATVDSFIDYMKKWKNKTTVIFADEPKRTLNAVIDGHDADGPAWCDHKAVYSAQLSREAQAWIGKNNVSLPQVAFAEFLEERAEDVVAPSGASLLEIALKLQVIKTATFGSSTRLQTGEFQFHWSEENQKGTVELPEKITLGIPLFHNGEAYKIEARLRYRLDQGKVNFTYKLVDIDAALEHAFGDVISRVRASVEDVAIYSGNR